MDTPCKTAAGHAELAVRQRGLSQRHRTLLFLVDGRRSLDEVIALGLQAGVPKGYIDELMALGLVVLAAPVQLSAADDLGGIAMLGRGGMPPLNGRSGASTGAGGLDEGVDEAVDTRLTGLPLSDSELAELDRSDGGAAQARRLMMQLLHAHGSVTTAVTLLRVRRARDRATLLSLVSDIRSRLTRAGVAPVHLQVLDEAERSLNVS